MQTRSQTQRTQTFPKTDVGTAILPGSNNAHTSPSRPTDPWQRDFNGHDYPSLLESYQEDREDDRLARMTARHLDSGGKVTKGYLADGFVVGDGEISEDEDWSGSETESEDDEDDDDEADEDSEEEEASEEESDEEE